MGIKRLDIFRLTLLLVIFLTGILTILAKNYDYFTLDLQVTRFIQNINITWLDNLLRLLTYLGNAIPSLLSIVAAALVLITIKRYWEGVCVVVSGMGAILISETFKLIIARPRPNGVGFDSFPSGHVLYAVGLYGFLFFLVFTRLRERHILRPFLLTVCSIPLLLMGVSRVYLGSHWFSDVLGAYLISYIWLFIVTHLYMARR